MGCGSSKPDHLGERDRVIARPIYTPPQKVQSIDNWHSYPPSNTTQRVSVPSQAWPKSSPSPSPSPPGSYSQHLPPQYQPPFPAELPPSPNTQFPPSPPTSAWRHPSQSESPSPPPPQFRPSSLSPEPATAAAPQCRKCGQPGRRSICQHPNANGNGGRPQYICAQPDCNNFICFDDLRGVHLGNPECKCAGNSASRAMVTAQRQVIYKCARGQCKFWQKKYEANGGLAIVRSGPLTPQQAVELGF